MGSFGFVKLLKFLINFLRIIFATPFLKWMIKKCSNFISFQLCWEGSFEWSEQCDRNYFISFFRIPFRTNSWPWYSWMPWSPKSSLNLRNKNLWLIDTLRGQIGCIFLPGAWFFIKRYPRDTFLVPGTTWQKFALDPITLPYIQPDLYPFLGSLIEKYQIIGLIIIFQKLLSIFINTFY